MLGAASLDFNYLFLEILLQGKTVEVGRAHFETETTRFTILDAPVSEFSFHNNALVFVIFRKNLCHTTEPSLLQNR